MWKVQDRKRILLSVFDGIGTAMLILSFCAYQFWLTFPGKRTGPATSYFANTGPRSYNATTSPKMTSNKS